MNVCGEFNATTRYKQTVYRFDVILISGNTSNLLARDVAVNKGLVKRLDQIGSSKPASIGLMKTERTGSVGEPLTDCAQGWAVRKQ